LDIVKGLATKNIKAITGKVEQSNFDPKSLFSMDFLQDLKKVYDTTDGVCKAERIRDREDLKIQCARSVLNILEKRDVLGLSSVALAFLQPKCTSY